MKVNYFKLTNLGMSLKNLYLNHITHMLNYIKYLLEDENNKETEFEKNYFISILEENRKNFCKVSNIDYNESNAINIEKVVKRELDEEDFIRKNKDFVGDRSYNMSDNYNFRQLVYFEYLAPFLKRNIGIKKVE